MRIGRDGFIDIRDQRRVRMPGNYERQTEPMPEKEAMAFLLSHSFPGHRMIVRALTLRDCRKLREASWASSINARMALLDQVWRSITSPVPPPRNPAEAELIQVVQVEGEWAYPVYLDGEETRVLPAGGRPLVELQEELKAPFMVFNQLRATA